MNGYPRFGWVDILRFQHCKKSAGGTCRIALPASMQSGEPTVTGNTGDVTREGEVLVIPTQKSERIIISWP